MQMFAYPSLLLILPFALFLLASTADWPWTKTRYLARSNWSSLVVPHGDEQHSVWFIFHYLNYCGHCKRAEPGWEAIAQYALRKHPIREISFFIICSQVGRSISELAPSIAPVNPHRPMISAKTRNTHNGVSTVRQRTEHSWHSMPNGSLTRRPPKMY